MNTTYQRKVSPLERLFIMLADTEPPFCNQMILEGIGEIDESRWKDAIAKASEANPGSRILYKGRSLWAKWVDSGITPPLRYVDGSKWSGYNSDGAPFFYEPLPFRTSHSAEVLVVKGSTNPQRLIFRSLHATMDAGGTWIWVQDIFRALRNEPLIGWNATANDNELVKSLNLPPHEPDPRVDKVLTPIGPPDDTDERGYVWNRFTINGKYSKLLPQMAIAAAKEARKHGQGTFRLYCPLELRRRVPGTTSTANLSRRFCLDVYPDSTVDSLAEEIKEKVENLKSDPKMLNFLIFIPSGLIKFFMLRGIKNNRLKNRFYNNTGTISNGGRLTVDFFHGGGFEGKGFFWVPPVVEKKPMFVSTVGYAEDTLEVVTAMPKVLASNGRLDELVTNILAQLESK